MYHIGHIGDGSSNSYNKSFVWDYRFAPVPQLKRSVVTMIYKDAIEIIKRHGGGSDSRSFMDMLLMCEFSGEIDINDLKLTYSELIDAFEIFNETLNFSDQKNTFVDRELSLDICAIIAEGWDRYIDWSATDRLPLESLEQLSAMLSDLQFAWCRILDGSTKSLSQAIENRKD